MSMNSFLGMIFSGYVLYGLSGSLLNSVWPKVADDIGVAVALIGVITTLCNVASGITSFFAYKFRQKFGTNNTISIGLLFMCLSLAGFFIASNIYIIYLAGITLGIGNAIVDVGSNSYVIKAYNAKSVSMLHACWGVGSAIGPIVMAFALTSLNNFRVGFAIGVILNIVVIIVLRLLKISWEKKKKDLPDDIVALHSVSKEEKESKKSFYDVIKIKLALVVMLCFFFGNAFNGLMNTWLATFFVASRNISVVEGANTATIFFAGLTITRIILGFIADNFKTKNIIRFGLILSFVAVILFFVNSKDIRFIYLNVAILGIGVAPIIPFSNHFLKELFGSDNVGEVLSFCSVFSMVGFAASSFFATLFVNIFGIGVFQIYVLVILAILIVITVYITNKHKIVRE